MRISSLCAQREDAHKESTETELGDGGGEKRENCIHGCSSLVTYELKKKKKKRKKSGELRGAPRKGPSSRLIT